MKSKKKKNWSATAPVSYIFDALNSPVSQRPLHFDARLESLGLCGALCDSLCWCWCCVELPVAVASVPRGAVNNLDGWNHFSLLLAFLVIFEFCAKPFTRGRSRRVVEKDFEAINATRGRRHNVDFVQYAKPQLFKGGAYKWFVRGWESARDNHAVSHGLCGMGRFYTFFRFQFFYTGFQ